MKMSVDTDNVISCLGCLGELLIILVLFVVIPLYSGNKNGIARMEKERSQITDSMRAVRIRDSIRHTPAYLDSVRQAEERHKLREAEWEKERRYAYKNDIIGFWHVGDSIYHTHFSCSFYKDDIKNLKFITQETADRHNLKECDDCYNEWENFE